jgi:hypothetical protein
LANGTSYTQPYLPAAGKFTLVWLAHVMMTATVHVLDVAEPLPHDQAFHGDQAHRETHALLSDVSPPAHAEDDGHAASAGAGIVVARGGGLRTAV